MARALGVKLDTVMSWKSGQRGVGPGIRAEIAVLLRRNEREAGDHAAALEGTVGLYHGLTRRELALIGHVLDGTEFDAALQPEPAQALWARVVRDLADGQAGGRVVLDDGEAERLDAVLSRLTDKQAMEVVKVARDVDDLTTGVPDD